MTAHTYGRLNSSRPFLLAVVVSVAGAAGIAFQPIAVLAIGGLVAVGLLTYFPARYAVALLLVYLAFEEFILTHFAGGHTAVVRYAPELAVQLLVTVAVLARIGAVAPLASRLLAVLSICVVPWLLSALVSGNGLSTALIGMRSELRFASLCLVPLLLKNPQRDLTFVARVVIWVAAAQSLIAYLEFVGGYGVRAFFATNWKVEVSGVTVSHSAAYLGTVFGTFSNRNALATFLVIAWILLASAGSQSLGFSRREGLVLGSMFAVAILLSGSREGAAGLALSGLVIARQRFHLPVVWLATLAVLGAALLAPALTAVQSTAPQGNVAYTSLGKRWRSLLSSESWSTTAHSNSRFYLLKSEFDAVKADAPISGFGLGSLTDPRRIADGTSSAYRTSAGRQVVAFRFFFDGNWGLILFETGLLGAAALGLAFLLTVRFGLLVSAHHWVGLALATSALAVGLLGFFSTILQSRAPSAVLWLLLGFAAAIHHDRRASEPANVHPSTRAAA